MASADYPQMVNLQSASQQMAAVQLVNDLADGSPTALVQVTTRAPQNTLSVYVFGCTMQQRQPQLIRLFSQQGLVQGRVELTAQHTLLTEARDTLLPSDVTPFLQPLQQNVYQEYSWQQNAFVQVPFVGFYPVTSKTEASALQQSANDGQKLPWNDPVTTALQMSKDLLQWATAPQAQLLSHTGDTAVVELTKQNPHIALTVTLRQLVQQSSAGLWFVIDARTKGMLVAQSGTLNAPLTVSSKSPLRFSGANALVDGITTATLFDHTMTPVSQANAVPLDVHADSSYTGTLSYTNLTHGQQGVLLIESLPRPRNFIKESGQILLSSVILN
jgi:hypothetical protein